MSLPRRPACRRVLLDTCRRVLIIALSVATPAAALAAGQEAGDARARERSCHLQPPGLRASQMAASGFVVHYLSSGEREYVRLDYVFPDGIYYRQEGRTWRALYLAHPSAVVQRKPLSKSIICGYVIGFPLDNKTPGEGGPQWSFLQDVDFVETP